MTVTEREIPLYTLSGVKDAAISTHYFDTGDKIGLSMLRFMRAPSQDPVLIIHGLTTSSDMFIMPEHYNLVSYLLDHGFTDVWTLDYRMSNRHPYNLLRHRFNMDDVALFDHPAAIAKLRDQTGQRRVHVIAHCLGSMSFAMSLFGGAVEDVTSFIANSVALTPRIRPWALLKGTLLPFLLENVVGFVYVNPNWSQDPGFSRGKLIAKACSLFHPECDVRACHMLSVMWGAGQPALYRHENLAPITHRRGGDLYGPTSLNYQRHVMKMVRANNTAIKLQPGNPKYGSLPDNYFDRVARVETPTLFMTGEDNKVFTDSNVECHRRLEKIVPGRHELRVFEGYGHQDVFMGKDVANDIFPTLLAFLQKHAQ